MTTDRNQPPTGETLTEVFSTRLSADDADQSSAAGVPAAGNAMVSGAGTLAASGFYALVWLSGWEPLQRYFLGHPVAIVATALFWVALAVLIHRWWMVTTEWNHLRTIRDEDLLPSPPEDSPAERWLGGHDAAYVAEHWLASIGELPQSTRQSRLVRRLSELLVRQSRRSNNSQLSDDLRELSERESDSAHDSLGLVRIIVWAIPMLGFLGTVIGITQTLGGLDFTDGSAAVDRLKSGLYVAFDTTALGLVLSVLAIFIQFPIERTEQHLLSAIDGRVGGLLSQGLPSGAAADNQTALVADLCEGIQAAVEQSLSSQTELWRQTIDEANRYWQDVRRRGVSEFVTMIDEALSPALREHATSLRESLDLATGRIADESSTFAERLDGTLKDHSSVLDESARMAGNRLESQLGQWQEILMSSAESLISQHQSVAKRCEAAMVHRDQAEAIQLLQTTLDSNLERLRLTTDEVSRSVEASAGEGMADAMRFLARAVDSLAIKLPDRSIPASDQNHGRAA